MTPGETQQSSGRRLPWRHRRVWVEPTRSESLRIGWDGSPHACEELLGWIQAGRPLVGRAAVRSETLHPDFVPLGLALQPIAQKRRLAVMLPLECVARSEAALPLEQSLPTLPPAHRRSAERVLSVTTRARADASVFGSAFWSHALGESCMHADSDLDLLLSASTRRQVSMLVDELLRIDALVEVRLDGELLLPCGGAVAWRELAQCPETILVKTDAGPELRPIEHVWSQWP